MSDDELRQEMARLLFDGAADHAPDRETLLSRTFDSQWDDPRWELLPEPGTLDGAGPDPDADVEMPPAADDPPVEAAHDDVVVTSDDGPAGTEPVHELADEQADGDLDGSGS